MTHRPRAGRWWGALVVLLLLAAAALRVAGARGELWLDEIWSIDFARQAARDHGSLLAIVTEARHDNNHLLNTAFVYLLGEREDPRWYRAASVLAGIASLLAVVMIGRERSRAEATIGLVLFGSAYLLVLYGSEARGYSQAVSFALFSYWALRRHLAEPRAWTALLFSLCGALGLLAHLSFIHFSLGALLWSTLVWLRKPPATHPLVAELARCHALPAAVAAALYFTFVRGMVIAGGPSYSLPYALARSASLMLGLPSGPRWLPLCLVLAVAFYAGGVATLARRRPTETVGLVLLTLASPALVLVVTRPELIYPRYLLVTLTFVLLIWVQLLAELYRRGGGRRALAATLLAVLVACNAAWDAELLRWGRGAFGAALEHAIRETPAPVVTIGVEPDPISSTLLRFHSALQPPRRAVRYFDAGAHPERGVDWLVRIAFGDPEAEPRTRRDRHGNRYHRVRLYRAARESGFPVLLYRLERPGRGG